MPRNIININPLLGETTTGVVAIGGTKIVPLQSGNDYDIAIRNGDSPNNCCGGTSTVEISTDPGNTLEERDDGLYAAPSGVETTTISAVASNCIDVAGDGSVGDPLVMVNIIDPDPDNRVSCGATGLLAVDGPNFATDNLTLDGVRTHTFATNTMTWNSVGGFTANATGSINLNTSFGGSVAVISTNTSAKAQLSSDDGTNLTRVLAQPGITQMDFVDGGGNLAAFIVQNGISGEPQTFVYSQNIDQGNAQIGQVLTLMSSNGEAEWQDVPDSSGSSLVTVSDTSCLNLTISGDGSVSSPFDISAVPIISPDANNAIECRANGLYTAVSGGAASDTFIDVSDSTSIDFAITGTGTGGDPYLITGDVIISPDMGNTLESRANGLYVPPNSGSGGGGDTFVTVENADVACVNLAISGDGSLSTPYSLSARLELDEVNPNIIECLAASGLRVESPRIIDLDDRGTFAGDCANYNDVKNYMLANYGDVRNLAFVYRDEVWGGVTNPHCAYVWAPDTFDQLMRLDYTCGDTLAFNDLGTLIALPATVPAHNIKCPVHYYACLQGTFDLDLLAGPITNLQKKDLITFVCSTGSLTFTSPCTGHVYTFGPNDLITLRWVDSGYFMS